MSSYGTPFLHHSTGRPTFRDSAAARLFNRTIDTVPAAAFAVCALRFPTRFSTAYETKKKNVLRSRVPEEAVKKMVFIIIVIVIIIIKFDVKRHFLIKARAEENITTIPPLSPRVAGKVAVTPADRYYLFISPDTLRKMSNYVLINTDITQNYL